MRSRIKIVPAGDPNVPGRWIPARIPDRFFGSRQREAFPFGERFAPPGFMVVAYRRAHRTRRPRLGVGR